MIEKLKESWVRLALGALVLAVFLCHATNLWRMPFVDQMENLAYDTHLRLTMPGTRDDSVVIVDIDEVSLRAEGRWPWPRDKLARLVEKLFEDYGIRLLGFDIVFAEPDESSGLRVLEGLAADQLRDDAEFQRRLAEVRPRLDYDTIFSETIGRYPVVLGYYFNIDQGLGIDTPRSGAMPPPVLVKSVFQGKKVQFLEASGYGGNLPRLTENAIGGGHFSQQPDQDGVVRRVPMLVRFDENYYPSLSLEMVRHALGGAEVLPRFEKPLFDTRGYPGLEWLTVGTASIPVDRHVKTLVPFRGRQGSYPYIPATQVLHGTADKSVLEGKIVLVGTSAPGLLDLRATPMEEAYPGVEVHASLIAGILRGEVMQFPEYTLGAEVILLLVTGVAMTIAGAVLSPLVTTVVTIVGTLAYLGLNHLVWMNGIVLPVASGILMVLTLFLLHMSYGYFVETRGKRQLTGLFGQYVPPELVDEMARAPSDYSLEAENRELSVLFSDVRGFTTISEGLAPKDLAELMNQFLTPMTEVIHTQRGTIDKYMGDAIMAFWGAPVPDQSHALHAVEAGMQMIARLDEVNRAFVQRGWPEVRIGVGINTGTMSVGNMGSAFRMAYTVMGDEVNLGSRLEGLTKNYGVSIICSESTMDAVPEYAYREIDRVRVKGKAKPVAIFEPLCRREALDATWKKELKLFHEALRLYRSQQWDMAELNFVNLMRSSRAPALYRVYVDRIQHFRSEPPPHDWDGVFDHQSK